MPLRRGSDSEAGGSVTATILLVSVGIPFAPTPLSSWLTSTSSLLVLPAPAAPQILPLELLLMMRWACSLQLPLLSSLLVLHMLLFDSLLGAGGAHEAFPLLLKVSDHVLYRVERLLLRLY